MLAYTASGVDPDIGLLLPCNVVVRADQHGAVVGFMDPAAIPQLADKPEVHGLGKGALARSERVRDNPVATRTTRA
jgi:Domain of unknown function DUF302